MTGWTGRVALVLASSTGGVGQHVAALAAGLVRAGATVTVCGPAAAEEQFGFTARGAAFAPVEIPPRPRPGDARAVAVLRRAVEGAQADLVHAHGLRAGLVAAFACGRWRGTAGGRSRGTAGGRSRGTAGGRSRGTAGGRSRGTAGGRWGAAGGRQRRAAGGRGRGTAGPRPLVVTWHNAVLTGSGGGGGLRASLSLRGLVARLAERIVARSADVTLGASGDLVQRASSLGAPDARLGVVAAPALPAPARSRAAVRAELGAGDEGVPVILSVGRLHPQKAYPVLVDAAARWRDLTPLFASSLPAPHPQVPVVVIAGSGPSHPQLAARISAGRAPVTLLGHRTDVADLLAAADLAVVSSRWEARQLFAQEALRSGTPLVATAVGGIPELVGDAAVLVPAGDVDALDAAVRRLLADGRLRAEYARRGLARADQWPTEPDTLARVSAVYAELAPSLARDTPSLARDTREVAG